jgi:LytTR family transcriptional regulator, CO-responsive transcriptional regulator RcoM
MRNARRRSFFIPGRCPRNAKFPVEFEATALQERASGESVPVLQKGYILNRLPVGAIILDAQYRIVSFDGVAAQLLGESALREAAGKEIFSVHSPAARAKIEWLLAQAQTAPEVRSASMIIDIPGKLLQLRATAMTDGQGNSSYCLILHDITNLNPAGADESYAPDDTQRPRPFFKLPVTMKDKVVLLDVDQVAFLRAEGHYSQVHTAGKRFFCNMPLSELEPRLPEYFVRVHRSYIVNIARASGVSNRDNQLMIAIEGEPAHDIPVSRNNAAKLRQLLGV